MTDEYPVERVVRPQASRGGVRVVMAEPPAWVAVALLVAVVVGDVLLGLLVVAALR